MSNNFIQRNFFKIAVVVAATMAMHTAAIMAQTESAAMRRFRTQGLKYERDNEFYSRFTFSPAEGLGLEEKVSRRDPTGVIKVGNLYYVWYRIEGFMDVVDIHGDDHSFFYMITVIRQDGDDWDMEDLKLTPMGKENVGE